jgi:hypothetical protein
LASQYLRDVRELRFIEIDLVMSKTGFASDASTTIPTRKRPNSDWNLPHELDPQLTFVWNFWQRRSIMNHSGARFLSPDDGEKCLLRGRNKTPSFPEMSPDISSQGNGSRNFNANWSTFVGLF